MSSRALLVLILTCVQHVGCGPSLPLNEIDCSRFPNAIYRDGSNPPEGSEMIDSDTAEKMLLHKEFPKYPELAMRAGLEGKVSIRLLIGKDGRVEQASILRSDADIFEAPSLDAAKKLLFKPAACDGIAVSVWAIMPMRFRLVDK